MIIPLDHVLFFKPMFHFFDAILHGIWSMAYIPANIKSEITSDRARKGVDGFCGSKEDSSSLDSIKAFPAHCNHWST